MRFRPSRLISSLPVLVIGLLLAAQTLLPAARLWHDYTAHAAAHEHDQQPCHEHDQESSCPTCDSIALARLADFTLPPVFIEFLALRPGPILASQVLAPTQAFRPRASIPRGPPGLT